ncbi:MAG: peptide chain release factor 2 [Ardenticatenaceae bacterium]|nr:peptide chain release factor 2 [Ardenticatenaceae bacterium]MCB8946823.1 peptide chain release factor 2 [Ardenticatenaceae bacterium]
MDELAEKLTNLQQTVNLLRRRLDVPAKALKVAQLEEVAAAPGFWDDSTKAQSIMRELTKLRDQVTVWEALSRRLSDATELAELGDEDLLPELARETELLEAQVAKLEFETLFSGEYDDENCILAIHAGAGGTEAQDWAQMLERMFMRWADSHEMVVDIVDESPGDEAGIKSVMMAIRGNYVYGRLQSERGVHRLVRISPYDSSSRRHTSFAKVEVWPDVAEDIEIDIDEKDLRIDRFKASGAGGQHVQKNETAVRITHIPTGIVVSCQNQRSLTQNREVAMKILKAQLFDLEQRKQEAEMAALKGEDVDAAWGSQIRSYVLHPYKMVKDHRTNYEVGNAQAVLDGRLDEFMEAYLKQKVGQTEEPTP